MNIVLLLPWTGKLSLFWPEVPPVCRLAGGLALRVCGETPTPLVSLDLFLGATLELLGLPREAWLELPCTYRS